MSSKQPTKHDDGETTATPDDSGDLGRRNFLKGVSAAGAAGATVIAGCSGGGGGGSGNGSGGNQDSGNDGGSASSKGEVHFLSSDQSPEFQQFWQKQSQAFEKEYGRDVEVTYAWGSGYDKRVAELLQAGNPPDAINLEEFNVGKYITSEVLYPCTDIVKSFKKQRGMSDRFRQVWKGDDRWYPSWAAATVHWYRGDQMAEKGWEGSGFGQGLKTPATYEEYLDFAKTMDGFNDKKGSLVAAGKTHWGTFYTWAHLWGNKIDIAKMTDDDRKPEVVLEDHRSDIEDFLNRYKDLYAHSPNTANYSWTASIDAFANDNVHEALYGGARQKIQSYVRGRSWAKDVVPGKTPKANGAQTDVMFPSGWGFMKGSGQPDGGKKFASYIQSNDDRYVEYLQLTLPHNSPITEDMQPLDSPVWDTELVNKGFTDAQLKLYLDVIKNGQSFSHGTEPPNMWAADLYNTFALGQMMFEALQNGDPVGEAADKMIQSMKDVVAN